MIKSMTAFARKQAQGDWGSASVELKTVNHRYLDINLRLPEALRELEMPIRDLTKKNLQRGKTDYSIRYALGADADAQVSLNQELVGQLIEAAALVGDKLTQSSDYSAMDLLRWPGVMQVAESDLTGVQKAILELVKETLSELNQVREREGAALSACIVERLDAIESQIAIIKPRSLDVVAEQRKKLQERIASLAVNVDEGRMEQEIALLAQRIDITEELDRLTTHVAETRRILDKGGTVGRRLDFLMQELNREANTLGSKSIDSQMTQAAVEIKVLIEQMREQIQNVE